MITKIQHPLTQGEAATTTEDIVWIENREGSSTVAEGCKRIRHQVDMYHMRNRLNPSAELGRRTQNFIDYVKILEGLETAGHGGVIITQALASEGVQWVYPNFQQKD